MQNGSVQKDGKKQLCCLRCGTPMKRVDPEKYQTGNLFIRQLAKIISGADIRIFRCVKCGRLEFFKKPENGAEML